MRFFHVALIILTYVWFYKTFLTIKDFGKPKIINFFIESYFKTLNQLFSFKIDIKEILMEKSQWVNNPLKFATNALMPIERWNFLRSFQMLKSKCNIANLVLRETSWKQVFFEKKTAYTVLVIYYNSLFSKKMKTADFSTNRKNIS